MSEKPMIVKTAEQLKRIREAHGLSQEQLALKLGVSSPTISMVEGGRREISAKLSRKVTEEFELTVEKIEEINRIYDGIASYHIKLEKLRKTTEENK